MLFVGGRIAVALRAGPATVFLRADLPAELTRFRAVVDRALTAEGLQALDSDSSLAKPLARERLGVDSTRWDLWGRDLADVFSVLAARAGGSGSGQAEYAGLGAGSAEPASAASAATPATPATGSGPAEPSASKETDGSDSGAPRGGRSPVKILIALGLVLIVVLGAAIFQTLRRNDSPPAAGPAPNEAPVAPLVDYVDPAGKFTLKYPETWRPVQTENPEVALILLGPEGASMLVRLVTLEKPVNPSNIADVKAVTDVIVQSPSVQIIQERPIDLPEAEGYYYLYRFQDQATQQQGVHSHFFLFKDRTLHTLVFQALPFEDFPKFAVDFDRIAESYRLTT